MQIVDAPHYHHFLARLQHFLHLQYQYKLQVTTHKLAVVLLLVV
jgi:hypothetical protein